ncbi:uncharacterized protein LOC135213944 [Macrobrachium nipponense]|uniref:uncharacterized protein LOC135213944 n=1 Tax=Macrobrachium nipponense TaxID=159736 RepID=UPI0030C7C62A
MRDKRARQILFFFLLASIFDDITAQEITVSPANVTTIAEETTTPYPEEGSSCTKNGRLPKYWLVSDTRCCWCRHGRVRCFEMQCPEAPTNTTGCFSRVTCGCTTWKCDSSEEDNSGEDSRERPFTGPGRRPGPSRTGPPSYPPGRWGRPFGGSGRGKPFRRQGMQKPATQWQPYIVDGNQVSQTMDCAEEFRISFMAGAQCWLQHTLI